MRADCINKQRSKLLSLIGFNKNITTAKGSYLVCDDGTEIIDFIAQYGSVPFGHNPEFIWQKISKFGEAQQPSFVQPFEVQSSNDLASILIDLAPGDFNQVTFACSGAETVEIAIKKCRSATNRPVILSAINGFHGKTLGALSATENSTYKDGFHVDTTNFEHIPYGNLESLKARLNQRDVAGFFVEPIQGEGGMITPPEGYLKAAKELCKQYGTLLVVDEIQTGLGRTGYMFACEGHDVEPDLILLAKALGGGIVAIGSCISGKSSYSRRFDLNHSSTFAGNGLSTFVGKIVVDYLNESTLISEVRQKGDYLGGRLTDLVKSYPEVYESVDGKGLMFGLKIQPLSGESLYLLSYASSVGFSVPLISGYLLNVHNICCLPTLNSRNVLRIEPALNISYNDIDKLIHSLKDVAERISAGQLHLFIEAVLNLESSSFDKNHNIYTPNPVKIGVEEKCFGRFAFFTHPTIPDAISGDLAIGGAGFDERDKEKVSKWMLEIADWSKPDLEAGISYHCKKIELKSGGYVEGWIINCLLQPMEIMKLSFKDRKKLLNSYFDIAKDLDVDMVGLGAYTSVITNAGIDVADRGLKVTTGNSLTGLCAVESLRSICKQKGHQIEERVVGVIGANGSVGRIASLGLVKYCQKIILLGNPKNPRAISKLEEFSGEMYREALLNSPTTGISLKVKNLFDSKEEFDALKRLIHGLTDSELYQKIKEISDTLDTKILPITVSVDIDYWLPRLQAVISATSQGGSFIDPQSVSKGAVICDASQPPDINVSTEEFSQDDVTIYEGGIIDLPSETTRFGYQNVLGLPQGKTFSCFGETIVLTMSQYGKNASIGRKVSLEEAQHIYDLALSHGFKPSVPNDNRTKESNPQQTKELLSDKILESVI